MQHVLTVLRAIAALPVRAGRALFRLRSEIVQTAGFGLLSWAGWIVEPALGLAVAGGACLYVGHALDIPRRQR